VDATELRALLSETAELLRRSGATARVYLVGGAAMALAYDADRTTRDLDALVLEGHGPLMEAAHEVARRHGLPGSWLNEQASVYVPRGEDGLARAVFDAPGLVVLAASPARLLAMKAHAARVADVEDIRRLTSMVGVRTLGEVEQLCARLVPDQPLSARSRAVLAEILDG
jgi:predicted nucleotidyltransferase